MGLWDEMFLVVRTNTLKLTPYSGKKDDTEALAKFCQQRTLQIELGFVEGFWGGCSQLNIPQFTAELISSLSDMAEIYDTLMTRLAHRENPKDILAVIQNTDKTVEKTLHFIIEHFVLPHINQLERIVN
jgi:hypothetical protein